MCRTEKGSHSLSFAHETKDLNLVGGLITCFFFFWLEVESLEHLQLRPILVHKKRKVETYFLSRWHHFNKFKGFYMRNFGGDFENNNLEYNDFNFLCQNSSVFICNLTH